MSSKVEFDALVQHSGGFGVNGPGRFWLELDCTNHQLCRHAVDSMDGKRYRVTIEEIEISPCPFCGARAVVRMGNIGNDLSYSVNCTECQGGVELFGRECDAIAAWNRRAEPRTVGAKEPQ